MITESKISKDVAELTKEDYPLFSDYCNFLDKGLRKDALKKLETFIQEATSWEYDKRVNFCYLLFTLSKTNNDLDIVLTTTLKDNFIGPTLLKMTLSEPTNFLPFQWYGQYFRDTLHLKKAFFLNP